MTMVLVVRRLVRRSTSSALLLLVVLLLSSHHVTCNPSSKPFIAYRTSAFDQENVVDHVLDLPQEGVTSLGRRLVQKSVLQKSSEIDKERCPLQFSLGISKRWHGAVGTHAPSFAIRQAPVIHNIFPAAGAGKQVMYATQYEHVDLLSPSALETSSSSSKKTTNGGGSSSTNTKQSVSAVVQEALLQAPDFPLLWESSSFHASPILHDVNGDGMTDVIVADYDGGISVMGLSAGGSSSGGGSSGQQQQQQQSRRYSHHTQVPRLYVRREWLEKRIEEVLGIQPSKQDEKDEEKNKDGSMSDESSSNNLNEPYHSYFEYYSNGNNNQNKILKGVTANVLAQGQDEAKSLKERRGKRVKQKEGIDGQQPQEESQQSQEDGGDASADFSQSREDEEVATHRRLSELVLDDEEKFYKKRIEHRRSQEVPQQQQQQQEQVVADPVAEQQQQQQQQEVVIDPEQHGQQQQQEVVIDPGQQQQQQQEVVIDQDPGEQQQQQQEQEPVKNMQEQQQEQQQEQVQQQQEQPDTTNTQDQQQQQEQQQQAEITQEQQQQQQEVVETEELQQQEAGQPKQKQPQAEEQQQQHQAMEEQQQREADMQREQQQPDAMQREEQEKQQRETVEQPQQETVQHEEPQQEQTAHHEEQQQQQQQPDEQQRQAEKGSADRAAEDPAADNAEQAHADPFEHEANMAASDEGRIESDSAEGRWDSIEDSAEFWSNEGRSPRYGDDLMYDSAESGERKKEDFSDSTEYMDDPDYGRDPIDDEYARYGGYDDVYGRGYNPEHEEYYDEKHYIRIPPHILCTPVLAELPKQYGNTNDKDDILFVAVSYFFDEDEYEGHFSYKRFNATDRGDETEVKRGSYVASALMAYILGDSGRWSGQNHLDLSTDFTAPENATLVAALPIHEDTTSMGAFALGSPTVADLDGDGNFEVMIGTSMGILYAFDARGMYKRDNWPVQLKFPIESRILVEDVAGDTNLEVFAADIGGNVVCFGHDAKPIWNRNLVWSLGTGGKIKAMSPMTLGDVDGDGNLDLVVSVRVDDRFYVFAFEAGTGSDLKHFPIELEGPLREETPTHSDLLQPLAQPLLVDLHGDQDHLEEYIRRKTTKYNKPKAIKMRGKNDPFPHGGYELGLHVVQPAGEQIFIIEGGSGCTQKVEIGDEVTAMVQVDDVHGTNRLDLVVATTAGNVVTLESKAPYHPLNVWNHGELRGRMNSHAHGYSATQGIFVHEVSRQYRDIFGVYVPVTFEIFDHRPNIGNEPERRKYIVEVRDGTSSKRNLMQVEYNSTGIYTERLYIHYGPGYYALTVLMRTSHGIVYEDSFSIGYNVEYLNGFGLLLLLPLIFASVAIMLCGVKKANWDDEDRYDGDDPGVGILGRALPE